MNLHLINQHIQPLDFSMPRGRSEAERDYFRYYSIDFEDRYDIVHHFGHFSSGCYDIVAHFFENKKAAGTCFIVHGYYDHAGLYGHLIEYCLQRNFSVVIFDLPGHGLSTGERASISSFADYQSVLSDVLSLFSGVAPRPWYAVGQSTGGAILMDFLLSGNTAVFSKTVLLAPLVKPTNWTVSKISHSLAKFFVKRVWRNFLDNSDDPEFLDFLKNKDPLQSRYLSLQWVSALKRWIKYFIALPSVDYIPLIIQGRQDETVDWQYNLSVVKDKFPKARIFYLKEGRHHLVNESEEKRASIFAAIDVYFDAFNSN